MWRHITRDLRRFPTSVLSAIDEAGCPVSVRCRPVADHGQEVLRLDLPPWLRARPGPAGLLGHSHNERLWALKSFGVRGTLERRDGHWVLIPERHVGGMGKGGLVAFLRLTRSGRRAAAAYLRARGLVRPRIPWHEYDAVRHRLEAEGAFSDP
jgi:hypothetical protein